MYSRGDLRLIDGLASQAQAARDRRRARTTAPARPARSARRTAARRPTSSSSASRSAPRRRTARTSRGSTASSRAQRNGIENKPRVRYLDLGDRTLARRAVVAVGRPTSLTPHVPVGREERLARTLSPNDGTLADRGARPGATPTRTPTSTTRPPARSVPVGQGGPRRLPALRAARPAPRRAARPDVHDAGADAAAARWPGRPSSASGRSPRAPTWPGSAG